MTLDPGGVNTFNPLSVMLLNQLVTSDPQFHGAIHDAQLIDQKDVRGNEFEKASDAEAPSSLERGRKEARGVIGPAKGI